jgi:hypothetical protein
MDARGIARLKLEPETASAHRLDHTLIGTVITERLSRRIDTGSDRCIGDEAPLPDVRYDLVISHQPTAMGDKESDQLEDLRLDVHDSAIDLDRGRIEVDREAIEYQQAVLTDVPHCAPRLPGIARPQGQKTLQSQI